MMVVVVNLKTTIEKSGYGMQNVSDGRAHFVLIWRKILFVRLVRDKHCFVLNLCPLYLSVLNCVTIVCALGVNYSTPLARNRCVPNYGS
jgi:hypothetical protein